MATKPLFTIELRAFNEDDVDKLHDLWETHLRKDTQWHFFWEGRNTLIRISKHMIPKVEKFLEKKNISFSVKGEWKDNIVITKEFQEEFQAIFHSYSEIAMKNVGSELPTIERLLDRVIHCFLNNVRTKDRACREGDIWNSVTWESEMIIKNGIERAITIGRMLSSY